MLSPRKKNSSNLSQIIKQLQQALEKNETEQATIYAISLFDIFNNYSFQKITLEEKSIRVFLWKNYPKLTAYLLETWVNSSEKKEEWRQSTRLIFKAMPKEYPDKEEYSEFLPRIIDLCHKENICGDNKTIKQPSKRKFEFFEVDPNKENKKIKLDDNQSNLEENLKNLKLSPIRQDNN